MTKKEAVSLYDSRFWEKLDYEQRTAFQLYEDRLCMPFSIYQEAVEKVLGRPVWTHEFAKPDRLRQEFEKKRPPPTMEEVIAMLPPLKTVVVVRGVGEEK